MFHKKTSHKFLNTVLLVDDDEVNNYIAKRQIQKLKFAEKIDVKMDGEDAVHHLLKIEESEVKLPDLILLDLNMPKMGGFEFLNTLNKASEKIKNIKVVILSSSVRGKDKDKAIQYKQVVGYVEKPLTKSILGLLKQHLQLNKKEPFLAFEDYSVNM